MEEKSITEKFAVSGWDLLSVPAQQWVFVFVGDSGILVDET